MRKRTLLVGVGCLAGFAMLIFQQGTTQEPASAGGGQASAEGEPARPVAGGATSPWPEGSVWTDGPQAVPRPSELAYFDDRVMARVSPEDLSAVLSDHGARLLRKPGPSGYVALGLPHGSTPDGFSAALAQDQRVAFAGKVGRISGASVETSQWHRAESYEADPPSGTAASALVAVLDTGMAYEAGTDPTTGISHGVAHTLTYSTIVDPYDFVNDDAKPYDDNMHGTHIASIIASDASGGGAMGLSRRSALMPLKVLDADSQGDEVGLVDALWWAIDNGADVANMSLSFHDGYTPSAALKEALEAGWEAEMVMVAAAGNAGGDQATWPARSPLVIGVASYVGEASATRGLTSYTNRGSGVLISAGGGDLSMDLDSDGEPDGLLAQTITPANPANTAHYFMAGSSQAAALVSSAAAWYRDSNRSAWSTYVGIQVDAVDDFGAYTEGAGAGRLSIPESFPRHNSIPQATHFVSMLPFLADNGDGSVTPSARLHIDEGTESISEVYVSFHGATSTVESCTPDSSGFCTVQSAPVSDGDAVISWVEVDGLIQGGVMVPGRTGIYVSDAIQASLDMITADIGDDTALGFYWDDESEPDLGELAAGMSLVNMSSSYATNPMGVTMNRLAMAGLFAEEEFTLDLDGSGFASSPMGFSLVKVIDGSGFASSPMGSKRVTLLGGSGFASSPMGKADKLLGGSGGTFLALDGSTLDSALAGTPIEDAVSGAAWATDAGVALADAIIATSMEVGIVESVEGSSMDDWSCWETGEVSSLDVYAVEATTTDEKTDDGTTSFHRTDGAATY